MHTPEVFPRPDGTTYVCAISSESPLPVDPAEVAPDPVRSSACTPCAPTCLPSFATARSLHSRRAIGPSRPRVFSGRIDAAGAVEPIRTTGTILPADAPVTTRSRRPVTSLVVTHEMRTVRKVADRVVMLYPLSRLGPGEPQIVYDGPADGLATAADPRVRQFVEGDARERLAETREIEEIDV